MRTVGLAPEALRCRGEQAWWLAAHQIECADLRLSWFAWEMHGWSRPVPCACTSRDAQHSRSTPSGELAGSEATTAAAHVTLAVRKPCFSCPEKQPWCHCTTRAQGTGIIEFRGRDTTMEVGAQLRATAGGC
jgi:hypothetical protein